MRPTAETQLHAAGRHAVLSRTHGIERSPEVTGRWGTSIVLLPSDALGDALAELTANIESIIGDGHWPSGGKGRAHVTVRALEPRGPVSTDRIERCAAAMERAGAAEPPPLRFTGLCLSPGSIMARASVDDRADRLRSRLASELGDDGWFEDRVFPNGRDPFWYVSLVHFARPIDRARELVDWVEVRRTLEIGHQTFDATALCSWSFDGSAMAPAALARAAIRGTSAEPPA